MGPSRSSSLRIRGDSSAVASSGRTRGTSDRSAAVGLRNVPGALPFPLDKGKGRINLIEYLSRAGNRASRAGPGQQWAGPKSGRVKIGPIFSGKNFSSSARPKNQAGQAK